MIPSNTPAVTAEIQKAAAENVKAGKWVAATPLLDKMRAALNDELPVAADDSST